MRHLILCAAFVASLSLVACDDESASPAASVCIDIETRTDSAAEPLTYEAVRLCCGGEFACCDAVLPCCPAGTVWPGGNGWPMLGPPLSYRDLAELSLPALPEVDAATLVAMEPFQTAYSNATILTFEVEGGLQYADVFGIPHEDLAHIELPLELDLSEYHDGFGLVTADGVAVAARVSEWVEMSPVAFVRAPELWGIEFTGAAEAVCRYDEGRVWQVDVRHLLVTAPDVGQQSLPAGESITYQWNEGTYRLTSHGGFLPPPFGATGGGQYTLAFQVVRQ